DGFEQRILGWRDSHSREVYTGPRQRSPKPPDPPRRPSSAPLTGTVDHELRKLGHRSGAHTERHQRLESPIAQVPGPLPRGAQADGTRVGRLAKRGIGPGGLAEQGRVALDIENVVLDLKREPDLGTVALERLKFAAGADARSERPQQHAALDQCAGLAAMHVLDVRHAESVTDGGQIDRLAARHSAGAGCARQGTN